MLFRSWVHKAGRINHPKLIARYLGRYVRHPAIANSRLIYFNGKDVGFFYEEHKEEQVIRHDVALQVDDFISALLQHIPEPQFKMIRYYGAYARRTKKIFKAYLQSSIKQLTLWSFGFRKEVRCPFCNGELEFVWYCKKPPPVEVKSQKEYAILTSEISKATFGLTPSQYQKFKGLTTQNLRDHMDDIELILTMLGEATTTRFTRDRDSQRFPELKRDSKDGGNVAGATRKNIEGKLGKSVVSRENYLKSAEKQKRIVKE